MFSSTSRPRTLFPHPLPTRLLKRVVYLGSALCLASIPLGWAQPQGAGAALPQVQVSLSPSSAQTLQNDIGALRELLNEGYYALAAQVEGPRVVRQFPESAEAQLLYARALFLTGNTEEAAAILEAAVLEVAALEAARERSPGKGGAASLVHEVAHLDALVRAARGDTEGAAELLRHTFQEAPSYALAMDWGRTAWQGGLTEEAMRAYRAAMTTPAGQHQPWPTLNLARLQLLQSEFEAAIDTLGTTLDLLEAETSPFPSPAYIEAFYRLGEAYEALGEREQAVSNYQAARSADPDYTPAADALERLENP